MFRSIKRIWVQHPLTFVMVLAVFFRLLAVIFARGFGMIDDHFLAIESAQSWVDGYDYNSWLPGSPHNQGPTGHNFFFPGLHYLLFSFFKYIRLNDPQVKMLIVRFLNAGWSLLTVWFGFKITERISDKKTAGLAGLLLAILWFMPWVSVRDLVEVICIPMLVLAIWFIVSREHQPGQFWVWFLAGIFLGLAFNIRPQTVFFSAGVGLAALILRKFREFAGLILGAVIPVLLIQGTIDYFIWGKPFVEIIQYFRGNFEEASAYIVLPWYNYFLVVLGMLIPPVSFFLFFGFLREWKRHLLIFLPVALFFILHSAFPNKQERFILPILPFIIILGAAGWQEFASRSGFWQKRPGLLRACWIFFWVINLLFLPAVSTVYSKRSRVETMSYLSRYPDIKAILVDDANESPEMFPRFYLGQWPKMYDEFIGKQNTDSLLLLSSHRPADRQPRFILFTGDRDLRARVIDARNYFPYLAYETTIEPGLVDIVMHKLNPVNKVNRVYIYRNTWFIPDKIR
ncbi:MAG TPA: glycosyltransferase family 39 protein [Bacteroidales bacterium]|nr:glycosyltransferase family 39 protein [Bacteroidales bacterium]